MSDPGFYDYRQGPEPVAVIGAMRAYGKRVLARAILANDWYQGSISLVDYNAIDAVAFEIVSVGAGVVKAAQEIGELPPEIGDHCDIRSVAADRVNSRDPTGRYWLVDIADVAAVWKPVPVTDELIDACRAVHARSTGAIHAMPPANGQIEFAPG